MHDDIIYHKQDWGVNVIKHFEDEKVGAIGIAGSPYSAKMPGSWWGGGLVNESLIHVHGNKSKYKIKSVEKSTSDRSEVVVLDGVWICIRRELFKTIKFDQTTFKGFHFYDIDISLQIHYSGYKLYCVFDIFLQHLSKSVMNRVWVDNALLINKKWRTQLPACCIRLTYNQKCNVEYKTLNECVSTLLMNNVLKKDVYLMAIKELFKFYTGYFFYKTPIYLYRYISNII